MPSDRGGLGGTVAQLYLAKFTRSLSLANVKKRGTTVNYLSKHPPGAMFAGIYEMVNGYNRGNGGSVFYDVYVYFQGTRVLTGQQ